MNVRDPYQSCATCGEQRSCMLHLRAEFPPDAAKKYLKKHCPLDGKLCEFHYSAGLAFAPVQEQKNS